MKKKLVMKFTDDLSVTFQSSVSGLGEFGLKVHLSVTISVAIFSASCFEIGFLYIHRLVLVCRLQKKESKRPLSPINKAKMGSKKSEYTLLPFMYKRNDEKSTTTTVGSKHFYLSGLRVRYLF